MRDVSLTDAVLWGAAFIVFLSIACILTLVFHMIYTWLYEKITGRVYYDYEEDPQPKRFACAGCGSPLGDSPHRTGCPYNYRDNSARRVG